MRIQLDREYALKGDAHEVTLVQIRTTATGDNAGKLTETPVGHYRDVPQALEAFATRKVRMSDVSTIREYIDALREVRDEIRQLAQSAA